MPNFIDDSPPGECIFCRLVEGAIPAAKVYEDELTCAFMDIGQVNPGHVLVATRQHWTNIFDIPSVQAQAVMATAHRIATAARDAFGCPGLMLFQANGREGEQTVFHFHLHVVPRHADDGVGLIWPRKEPPFSELEKHAQALRNRLGGGSLEQERS
ncbi:HIT family protein [Acidovorax sp. SDU_ACID1]|uniref:HIT family protein n=1 Tax=Acidovorax sp. SDU_ACID1 TaxID=3136632 RepID=UPI003872F4C3